MNIEELRTGNLVIYETCTYEVLRVDAPSQSLSVRAVNHEWEIEPCGINEVSPIDIYPEMLKKNGFEVLNSAMPEIWIKRLGGYRYLRYHSGVKYLDFETTNTFQRVPWAVRYLHQMQNACKDYGLDITFKA